MSFRQLNRPSGKTHAWLVGGLNSATFLFSCLTVGDHADQKHTQGHFLDGVLALMTLMLAILPLWDIC